MDLKEELKLKNLVLHGNIDFQLVVLFLINRYSDDEEFIRRIRYTVEYFERPQKQGG